MPISQLKVQACTRIFAKAATWPPSRIPSSGLLLDGRTANSAGERYLNLEQIDVAHIGTDPAQAEDMKNRRVVTPPSLGITSDQFGIALGQVVDINCEPLVRQPTTADPEALREQMNGNRPSGVRALLSYKVRPAQWYLGNTSISSQRLRPESLCAPLAGRGTTEEVLPRQSRI